jgi:flagellar protein FliS
MTAYNNAARTAEMYRRQQILTASPAELTLMLYNGAIKFTSEAIKALEKKDYEAVNTNCIKAQNIISEFKATLKMEYDFSKDWMAMYNYIYRCLVEGNIKGDAAKLEEARSFITEYRDTWREVMRIVGEEKSQTRSLAAEGMRA